MLSTKPYITLQCIFISALHASSYQQQHWAILIYNRRSPTVANRRSCRLATVRVYRITVLHVYSHVKYIFYIHLLPIEFEFS